MAHPIEDYDQPDFYHFNKDSIELAQFIKAHFEIQPETTFCELGAGCGVISLELLKGVAFKECILIEEQEGFSSSLKRNLKNAHLLGSVKVELQSLFSFEGKFDCVYFNPPYFISEGSRPSPNPQKDHCRRISQHDWELWIRKAAELTKEDIFFCHREEVKLELKEVLIERSSGCYLHHYKI